MNLTEIIKNNKDYIIERRRYYHQHPELTGEEKETRAQIKRDLEEMGITDIKEMSNCYGLIATIHGGKEGKTIGLRADIDALPIKEETGLDFCSTNGNMHACGHDGHIAILLGAAKGLNEIKEELNGNVRLIIQPAEENATGANLMVEEGATEGVDAIYGGHIWSSLESGYVDVSEGPRMASAHLLTIKIKGVSAHGAEPHLGVDAITVAAAVINNLQQCVSRMNNPLNPLVMTLGKMTAGTRFNVIPNEAVIEGTVRTFSEDDEVERHMRSIIENTAKGFGAEGTLEYHYMTDPIINKDQDFNELVRKAAIKAIGEENIGTCQPTMGGEDFSKLSIGKIPYFFAFVGSRSEDFPYSNHQEQYTYDEEVLIKGSSVMAQVAYDFLNE